ncbi:MAG: hypothetical protein FWE49_00075 [Synergistaceae bacterium]|nr:hypothetical protein [Synergistaceae bacterium]
MEKNIILKRKILFLLVFSLIFSFISSTAYTGEIKEIWHHISINDTEVGSIDSKVKSLWKEFEKSSLQRGMLTKINYQPFVPVVNRIIILDTPLKELAYRNYCLRIKTEVVNGKDVGITEITLTKMSDEYFPEANMEQQFGYANGKLGKKLTFWVDEKKIIPEKLSAFQQVKKMENFKRSIELEYSGKDDNRRVPVEDVLYFFPELNSVKFSFDNLYPQNDTPMFETTYEPGRIIFGSMLDSDIRISYLHNTITGKMIRGEISWRVTFSEFATGEEYGLSESFFSFMQENLAKAGLIAPAVARFF